MANISYNNHNIARAVGLWYEAKAYEIINTQYLTKISTLMGLKICPFEVAVSATDVQVDSLYESIDSANIRCTLKIEFYFLKDHFLKNFDSTTTIAILDKFPNLWDYTFHTKIDWLENQIFGYNEAGFPDLARELNLEYFELNLRFNDHTLESLIQNEVLNRCLNTDVKMLFYNHEKNTYYFHNFIDASKDFRKIPQIRKIKL